MLTTILVPLDGSLQAEGALPIAEKLAHTYDNPLLLVRAAEQASIAAGVKRHEAIKGQAWEWSLEEAELYLILKVADLASTGFRVQTKAAVGGATPFIQQVAEKREVGLIVIASHGRSWLGRFVLGSVAQGLLQELDTPVLLLRRQPISANEEQPAGLPTQRKSRSPSDSGGCCSP